MPSQGDSSKDGDFLSLIKAYVKKTYNKPGNAYIGLLHRLDRPAGGVMVLARTSKAAARLTESIKRHEFEKRYLSVAAYNKNMPGEARLKNWLKKDERKNRSYIVAENAPGAKYAELKYRTVAVRQEAALLDIELKTGRSHQIRAQMAHAGAPLYGDYRYGGKKEGDLALWAYKLAFIHPVKKEKLTFVCAPPPKYPWIYFEDEINSLQ